jgi:putative tryptophan/tyrosine transport system substrate-binding protein
MLEGTTMTRRIIGLLVILALATLFVPAVSHAQRPAKVPRIGMLLGNDPEAAAPSLEAFRQRLRELGYVEGQTIAIESRFANGQVDPLPALAAALVQLPVDVIVTWGTPATQSAQHVTTTIPIVIGAALDPVATGLVASLARPGGNITGVTSSIVESAAKALQVFKEAVPRGARMAVLWNPPNPTHGLLLREVEIAARALGVPLQPLAVSDPMEFESAFTAMAREHTGALLVIGDPFFQTHRRRLAEFARAHGLPTMFDRREYVEVGGLMAYGPSFPDQFRRTAVFVEKILKGAKPAELPMEQPRHLKLIINLKTAQALGLTIPPMLLFQADEVIR